MPGAPTPAWLERSSQRLDRLRKRAKTMIMPNWPAAMSRELALAYTGVAQAQLREWERNGSVVFIPRGPRGAKIALRTALDSALADLFIGYDQSTDLEFD